MGPESNDKCHYKEQSSQHGEEETACEERGTDWREAATSQGMPAATRSSESKGSVLPRGTWTKHSPADTLIQDFRPPNL